MTSGEGRRATGRRRRATRCSATSSPSRSTSRWSAPSSSTPCRSSSARALPDVRDGLKPVHRRILYSMFDQGLRPDRPFAKCAKVVGDVMGTYHPHGDTAIYDAMVRMVVDFSMRHPLVSGHGNFGGTGPDEGAAAMRYTECRLAPARARDARLDRRGDGRLRVELRRLDPAARRCCRRASRTCS